MGGMAGGYEKSMRTGDGDTHALQSPHSAWVSSFQSTPPWEELRGPWELALPCESTLGYALLCES